MRTLLDDFEQGFTKTPSASKSAIQAAGSSVDKQTSHGETEMRRPPATLARFRAM